MIPRQSENDWVFRNALYVDSAKAILFLLAAKPFTSKKYFMFAQIVAYFID